MQLKCSQCNQVYKAPTGYDYYSGDSVKCPQCRTELVPTQTDGENPDPTPAPPSATIRRYNRGFRLHRRATTWAVIHFVLTALLFGVVFVMAEGGWTEGGGSRFPLSHPVFQAFFIAQPAIGLFAHYNWDLSFRVGLVLMILSSVAIGYGVALLFPPRDRRTSPSH